jgi:hypothetical protein
MPTSVDDWSADRDVEDIADLQQDGKLAVIYTAWMVRPCASEGGPAHLETGARCFVS